MALTIVSGNLNIKGDSGNHETDPSTWGFALTHNDYQISRKNGVAQLGLNSAEFKTLRSSWEVGNRLHGFYNAPASYTPGKLYLAKVYIYVPSSNPIASSGAVVGLECWDPNVSEYGSYKIDKGIALALDSWTEIQTVFQINGTVSTPATLGVISNPGSQTVNYGGVIYFDNFRIYEVTEAPVAQPSIEIDINNTVITHESSAGANDGSITVAIISSDTTAPIEYSKDNGSNWQSSNQFTGLAPGTYLVRVRDSSSPPAEDYQSFSINAASPNFDFTTSITHESISGAGDGVIEVTVTGTGGPFTFSKDGGSTYQGSNIFSGLAPGTYVIAVKDAGGNIVSHNATVNPGAADFDKVFFDKNPVPLDLYETANGSQDNYKIFVDVKVEDQAGSGSYISKMQVAIPPDSSGKSHFELRKAFRGVLTADPPNQSTGTMGRLKDRIKLFIVQYGDIYDDLTQPGSLITTVPSIIMLGGLAKRSFPDVDFFSQYLPTYKKFMSWAPVEKYIDDYQEDYLNFWIYDQDVTTLKLMIKAYYDDNTDQSNSTRILNGVEYGQLFLIPAGPSNSGANLVNSGKNMIKYDLWLTDQNDAVISEVRTYKITEFKHPNTRYIMFLNSLGAYEVIRTTGQSEEMADFEREILQKNLPSDYSSLDGEYQISNVSKTNRFIYSSGYFTGRYADQWLEHMQELYLSPKVYDVTDGIRVPIIIQSGSMQVRRDSDNKRFIRFEAIEAYFDYVNTPRSI